MIEQYDMLIAIYHGYYSDLWRCCLPMKNTFEANGSDGFGAITSCDGCGQFCHHHHKQHTSIFLPSYSHNNTMVVMLRKIDANDKGNVSVDWLDWFFTGKSHGFPHEIEGFPVIFPLNPSIDHHICGFPWGYPIAGW